MINRVLVIVVARFGDTLLVTPVLRRLKAAYPDAELTVLAHHRRAEVLEHLPCIDKLGTLSKRGAPWRGRFGLRRYDLALVYGDDREFIDYAARVSRKVIAFGSGAAAANVTLVPPPTVPTPAQPERAMLLDPLGLTVDDWRLAYTVTPVEAARADAWVAGRRLVGLQLQSFPAKAYRDWPLAHFAELARRLLATYPDMQLVLLGGPEGRDAALKLEAELASARVSVLAGTVTMRENAAIMARLALYVGVDTGPTHLAGALGVPMVAMYHAFHPGYLLAPLQHPALTVLEHPDAGEGARRDAPMADITVDTVWAAVQKRLGDA
ncbi:glycosyltransferase family 9 protein [Jeongeupia wiesaeckerbachi]|uniref:glycosyltransferase family 9 protein n=1 Tax=Jeongeupia wiesaeckerbachi TaxID=3051218 RepID=UPI003D801A1F